MTECHYLPLKVRSDGYMRISINGKMVYAHRRVFEQVYGPIPAGFEVCHICDNRACVNPEHLFLGTHADNMRDAADKGRTFCGGRPKIFTPEQIAHICWMLHCNITQQTIARIMGCSQPCISYISNQNSIGGAK